MKNFGIHKRLTIGTKLVALIAMLLILSVVTLVFLSTRMFSEDTTSMIQQTNADTAASLALQTHQQMESIGEKMGVIGTTLIQESLSPEVRDQITREFFDKDSDFLAVFVQKASENGEVVALQHALSKDEQVSDPNGSKLQTQLALEKDYTPSQVAKGENQTTTFKLPDGTPGFALSIPFIEIAGSNGTRFSHILTAVMKQNKLGKIFGASDLVNTFLVDRKGKLLAHPDAARVASGESVSKLEIVKLLLEGKANNQQTRYFDPLANEWKLGAFHVVGFGGLGVVAEEPEAKAFEAAEKVKFRSALVGFIVLCIAFLTGYLYSGTLTRPIKLLVTAANRISKGDFKINLVPKGRDEIASLSLAFNDMAKGLEERDRVKETFNKFHNKEIADKLLSGEVKLGGERKTATVFFSDVRGFTALSEAMQPEEVVEMLNEYMTRMVSIIRAHGGIVDKYIGDAIMALWGVPLTGEDDAYRAVRACIAMREDMAKLNDLRISRGQPILKIGIGLNTGPLIAGNIGSNEKMEYTVIGDAVNLASRVESMTKEYGTDLLISKSVFEEVGARFVVEKCKSAKVKGKTDAVEIYKVRGYLDENNMPVIVETPYSSYASEKSDKAVHDPKEKHEEEVHVETVVEAATIAVPEKKSASIQVPTSPTAFSAARNMAAPPARGVRPPLFRRLIPIVDGASPIKISEHVVPKLVVPPPFKGAIVQTLEWYLQFGAEALGPFSKNEIIDGLKSGDFTPETQFAVNSVGPWTALAEDATFQTKPDEKAA